MANYVTREQCKELKNRLEKACKDKARIFKSCMSVTTDQLAAMKADTNGTKLVWVVGKNENTWAAFDLFHSELLYNVLILKDGHTIGVNLHSMNSYSSKLRIYNLVNEPDGCLICHQDEPSTLILTCRECYRDICIACQFKIIIAEIKDGGRIGAACPACAQHMLEIAVGPHRITRNRLIAECQRLNAISTYLLDNRSVSRISDADYNECVRLIGERLLRTGAAIENNALLAAHKA